MSSVTLNFEGSAGIIFIIRITLLVCFLKYTSNLTFFLGFIRNILTAKLKQSIKKFRKSPSPSSQKEHHAERSS